MRVISQDGTMDVPYENVVLYQDEKEIMCIFSGIYIGRKLAQYSTEEKAIKAMEMLRGRYGKLEVMKVIASGTAEYMEKSLSTNEMIEQHNAYCDMNVFQFPQDDEIEV
jgi:hypothetical protein